MATHRRAVELLDPDPELVSVVTRGANRRGWKIMKHDQKPDDCDDCALVKKAGAGNIEGLAKHFEGEEHPFSACMTYLGEHGDYDEETAKAICGKVKSILHPGGESKKTDSEKGRMVRKVKGYIDTFVDMLRGLNPEDPLLAKFQNGDRPMHTLTLREQIEKQNRRDAITLSFNPALWDAERAIAFAKEHGFKADEVDATGKHIRLWQVEKATADSGYADFATVLSDLPEGVACIVAKSAPKNPTASNAAAPHNPPEGHRPPAPHNEPWANPNGVPSAKMVVQRFGAGKQHAAAGATAQHNPPAGTVAAPHNPTGQAAPPHNPPDNVVLPTGKPAWNTSVRSIKGVTIATGGNAIADACALLQSVLTTTHLDPALNYAERAAKVAEEIALFGTLMGGINFGPPDESLKTELLGRALAADALAQMPAGTVALVGSEHPVELSITPLGSGQEDIMTKEQEAKLDAFLAAQAKSEAAQKAQPAIDSAMIAEEVHKAVAEALGLKPEKPEAEKTADEKLAETVAQAVKTALGDLPQNVQRVIKAATGSRSARLSDTPETYGAKGKGLFDSVFRGTQFDRRAS